MAGIISLLKQGKTKKNRYYESLNEESIIDSKNFCEGVKNLVSDKNDKKNETIKSDSDTGSVLNNFFSNIVNNLTCL